jgi:hypothetical protein
MYNLYFCGKESKQKITTSHIGTRNSKKNDVFWDVTPFGSCKNQRFGGT